MHRWMLAAIAVLACCGVAGTCLYIGRSHDTLWQAAARGDVGAVRRLISQGANVDAVDGNKKTALHRAASGGSIPVMDLLIRSGARVHTGDANSREPIFYAVASDDTKAVEFLLSHGADINATSSQGATLIHLSNSLNMIRYLKSKGLFVDAKDKRGCTRLFEVVQCDEAGTFAKGLVSLGADVHARDAVSATLLHYAARGSAPSMVSYLLGKGLKINDMDKAGNTPLHYAAMGGGTIAVGKALIAAGANLEARNKDGLTPLQLADREMNYDFADFLRKQMAVPKQTGAKP